jgi:hypothetical protein
MARKVVSRKEKRAEVEAAERAGLTKKAAPPKKKSTPRKSRSKSGAEVRLKAYWGVFNQSLKRVALYEYADKKKAEKRAQELSESGNKTPHFVQPVKEAVQEG